MSATKFRERPVVIEAIQWVGHNFVEIDEFITVRHETYPADGRLVISTPEGDLAANLGDWIIRGMDDFFYPCKAEDFERMYEPTQ